MRVIAYIPLYYGKEYLREAILSLEPFVEKILVVYTPQPSQGSSTVIPCPESESELKNLAESTSQKIEWHRGVFAYEAQHRDYIYQFTNGYDLVLTVDADEVVEPNDIQSALEAAYNSDKRWIGINGFINFWRSFDYACYDGFTPIRITNLKNKDGQGVVNCRYYHFSCAQSEEIVRFKWNVSGHKNEIRQNWVDEVWKAWTPENNFGDLHPVARGLWNATPFDKTKLPDLLKHHPNYEKELI